MRKFLALCLWALLLCPQLIISSTTVLAQNPVRICFTTNAPNCQPVDATNPLPVTISGGGGGDVNLTEVGGVAVSLGQKAMAASIPVTIANNQSTLNVQGLNEVGTGSPLNVMTVGFTDGANTQIPKVDSAGSVITTTLDPCSGTKSSVAISQATSTVLVSASASNRIYVCSLALIAGAAEIVALTQGTGSVCATSADAIIGSTTIANGLSLAANGGLTFGNGTGTIARGPNTNEDVCLLQDGTDRIAGVMTYVLAP